MSKHTPPGNWWTRQQALGVGRPAIRSACAKPGDAILIVTEGTVTEQVYFKLVRNDLKLATVTVAIHPGDHSDARHVVKTAEKKVNDLARRARKGRLAMNEPSKYDHVYAVVDTDVDLRNGRWNEVVQFATARKVLLAESSPCFETWLLFHLVGPTTRSDLPNGDAAKAAVKKALGCAYSTNEKVAEKVLPIFIPLWPAAVKAAETVRNSHASAGTASPANPSTEVDRLICVMNDSAQPLHRKLPIATP
jgi:hypothetical protein